MAARKGGLGKGLDGLFPMYNTEETSAGEARKEKSETGSKTGNKTGEKAAQKTSVKKTASKTGGKAGETPKKQEKSQKQAPAEPEGEPVTVRLSRIEPNPEQPRRRFDEEALKELSDSIKEYGVLQPLVVKRKGDRFEIIAGERRWRAARLAGLKEVPVIIKDLAPKEILEISLVENLQREDLNAIEEAEAYDKLMTEFQLTQEQAAKRVSKSRTAVANAVRLLNLDPAVRQMVVEDQLSAGHARALLSLTDPELQKQAAEMVVSGQLSVRETEKLVKNFGKPEKKKPAAVEDPTLALIYHEMEENLKSALGTKVHVNRQGEKKGKIEIEYYSREELERIYDLLRSAQ